MILLSLATAALAASPTPSFTDYTTHYSKDGDYYFTITERPSNAVPLTVVEYADATGLTQSFDCSIRLGRIECPQLGVVPFDFIGMTNDGHAQFYTDLSDLGIGQLGTVGILQPNDSIAGYSYRVNWGIIQWCEFDDDDNAECDGYCGQGRGGGTAVDAGSWNTDCAVLTCLCGNGERETHNDRDPSDPCWGSRVPGIEACVDPPVIGL